MSKKILLIGDWIEDVSLYGRVTRLCPEAPTAVCWVPEGRELRTAGGMGLVAANLEALGNEVFQYVLSKSRKTRFWSGKHLIMRKDEDSIEHKSMDRSILPRLKDYDAVVVSDYQKGGVTDENAKVIAYYANQLGVKLFVDTKNPHPGLYKNCYAIFPNQAEMLKIDHVGNFEHVICKLGPEGCLVDGHQVYPDKVRDEFDPTGAGDVFLAAFVTYDLQGWCLEDCARFANLAAGISVEHQGSYVLTADDIKEINNE